MAEALLVAGAPGIGGTPARATQGACEAVRLAVNAMFTRTPAARVQAVTDGRNTPSVRRLQRPGFALLATQDALFRGAPCRAQVFVLTRPRLACAP